MRRFVGGRGRSSEKRSGGGEISVGAKIFQDIPGDARERASTNYRSLIESPRLEGEKRRVDEEEGFSAKTGQSMAKRNSPKMRYRQSVE